jgi:hypothetical protein
LCIKYTQCDDFSEFAVEQIGVDAVTLLRRRRRRRRRGGGDNNPLRILIKGFIRIQ